MLKNIMEMRRKLEEKRQEVRLLNKENMNDGELAEFNKGMLELRDSERLIDEEEVSQRKQMNAAVSNSNSDYSAPEYGGDPAEIRVYNKSNLHELRSAIAGMDKTGITEPISFGKFARGLVTGNWKGAEAEKRALGTAADGGNYLVPEIISSEIIEMALNKAQVINAGASAVVMPSKTLVVPRIIKMPETEWKAENIAFSKSMDMNFDGVTLVSKTLMSLISLSVELAEDGLGVPAAIENAIAKGLANEVDRACLLGAGGLEPLGIANTMGVLSVNLPSPLTDYSPFSRAYYKIEANNGTANSMIAASSIFEDLDLLVSGVELQPLQPPQSWSKYAQYSSNQLVDQAITGDFKQLLIGTRATINLEVTRSTETAFKNLQVWIRAYIRMDCAIKNVKHFCSIECGGSGSVSNSASASSSPSAS